jgi:hypothetical protein
MTKSKLLWWTLPAGALMFNLVFSEGRPLVQRVDACEGWQDAQCAWWCAGCCSPYSSCRGYSSLGYGWDSECGYRNCQGGTACHQC